MRVFIAIDIDKQIRAGLSRLQKELISKTNFGKSDVKWVEPDNVHLTLKFLGEIKVELAVESVGCFGGRSAKVLWVGLGEGGDNLLQLQKDLDEQLALAGWPPESREFTGHLTLCRAKNPKAGFKLAEIIKDYKDFKLGDMSVDSVCVYQSQLTPSGPIYTLLGKYKMS